MSVSKGEMRLILSDQTDEEIRKIDLFTESLLAKNLENEEATARLNAQRNRLIEEARKIMQLNIQHLDKIYDTLTLTAQAVDIIALLRRCFVLNYKDLLRLVVTDNFLADKQIELLQIIVSSAEKSTAKIYSRELMLSFFTEATFKTVR
jgi:hypothetical protein